MTPQTTIWLPIETAPKDGTEMVLLMSNRPHIGRWSTHFQWVEARQKVEGFECWQLSDPTHILWEIQNQPTHWFPIPSKP